MGIKKINVHGVEMSPMQEMLFMKWCHNIGVAMNTLTKEQRIDICNMFLRQANERINK